MRTRRILTLGLIAAVAALATACGKIQQAADRAKYVNDLKQFGMEMHNFHSTNMRMPKDANELMAQASPEFKNGPAAARVLSGEVEVVWGFRIKDQDGIGDKVMAWSSALAFGGNVGVLFADGTVATLSQAEFATAKKAMVKDGEEKEKAPAPTRATRPARTKK